MLIPPIITGAPVPPRIARSISNGRTSRAVASSIVPGRAMRRARKMSPRAGSSASPISIRSASPTRPSIVPKVS